MVFGLVVVNGLLLIAAYYFSFKTVFSEYGFIPAQPHVLNSLTSMFLHAGFWHFAGNMFFLWMFGYRVENTFGRWLFLLVYLTCGFGADALHYVMNSHSTVPSVGASGAISGIVGCYFVLFPKSRFDIEVYFFRFHVKTIPTQTHGAVGAWIAEQTILGILTGVVAFSSTAFWAHIGGFATGVGLTSVLLLFVPHLRARGDVPFVVRAINGFVQADNGQPLANARFELCSESGESRTVFTSPQGRFDVFDVPEGYYSYIVSADYFEPIEGSIVLQKHGRSTPIRIKLSPQPTETADYGNPAPKVEIQTIFHGNTKDQEQI